MLLPVVDFRNDCDVRLPIIQRFLSKCESDEQPGAVRLLHEELTRRDRLAAELTLELRRWKGEKLIGGMRRALD